MTTRLQNGKTRFLPFNRGDGMVLDLMRSLPEAKNVLDFVLVESINSFRAEGIAEISLGNAPLANAEKEKSRLQDYQR